MNPRDGRGMAMKCSAITRSGKPCKGTPIAGTAWCFAHHPDLTERRRQGAVKGGEGKRSTARARKHFRGASLEPADIHGLLSGALVKVSEGDMEPMVGNALANMSKALVVIEEASTLSERLDELERRAGIDRSNVTPMRRAG